MPPPPPTSLPFAILKQLKPSKKITTVHTKQRMIGHLVKFMIILKIWGPKSDIGTPSDVDPNFGTNGVIMTFETNVIVADMIQFEPLQIGKYISP